MKTFVFALVLAIGFWGAEVVGATSSGNSETKLRRIVDTSPRDGGVQKKLNPYNSSGGGGSHVSG